jgi:hypothetical protein
LIFGRPEFAGGSPQVKEENILQQVPFQNQKKNLQQVLCVFNPEL